jgi:hypothetical protein
VRDRAAPPAKFKFNEASVKALDEAFRGCFREMVEKPLDKDALTAIEQLAVHARATMSVVSKPDDLAEAEAAMALRRQAESINGYNSGGVSDALAAAPKSETFGAHIIREVMAIAKNMHRDPSKMVQAAATARDNGMHALADSLEAEIRAAFGGSATVTIEAPKVVKLAERRKKKTAAR